MKILMVNNQLSVLGGSETYMFSIGEELTKRGNDVQYFGVSDPKHIHTNVFGIYAKRSINPFNVVVNRFNVRQFGRLLDTFKPDIIHINLMYFVLTPKIIDEAYKRHIPVVHTVHDPKIVCPNHRLYNYRLEEPCMKCLGHGVKECVKNKCVKNSRFLSKLAVKEAQYYSRINIYEKINRYVFPSEFMKRIHIGYGANENNSVVIHNFSRLDSVNDTDSKKTSEKYVLYFGRVSAEKGMRILSEVVASTPKIKYKIAGEGPCLSLFNDLTNCDLLGFISGDSLIEAIKQATICVFPSIWYENCPMSIMESIALGTPVIGSNIGGIPELIENGVTGFIVKPASVEDLQKKIEILYSDNNLLNNMSHACIANKELKSVSTYVDELLKVYDDVRGDL